MNALSTRLTSLGLPAIIGVVLALALALTTGLSSLNFGLSGGSAEVGDFAPSDDKEMVSDQLSLAMLHVLTLFVTATSHLK
jgi:hypothetical protein